jgi:hypothetical protein
MAKVMHSSIQRPLPESRCKSWGFGTSFGGPLLRFSWISLEPFQWAYFVRWHFLQLVCPLRSRGQ